MPLEHIGIIPDGNGRWAEKRGKSHAEGHQAGAETMLRIIQALSKLEIQRVTLYTFSTENWGRPAEEIEALLGVLLFAARKYFKDLMSDGIRVVHLGSRSKLSREVLDLVDEIGDMTARNRGLTVSVALDYGGRQEIVQAVRSIVRLGLAPGNVTQELIAAHLYLPDVRDPELIIRTGGEQRLSNFLLWQSARSWFHVSNTLWPDFDEFELERIVERYQDA